MRATKGGDDNEGPQPEQLCSFYLLDLKKIFYRHEVSLSPYLNAQVEKLKCSLTLVKMARKTLFRTIATGEREKTHKWGFVA